MPTDNLRRAWSVATILLAAAVCLQAVFAGAMLSGVGWARPAHAATAALLIASAAAAGLFASVTLRRIPRGPGLGWTLLALATALVLQAALGALAAKGGDLLWVHVPLGVALVGFAALAVSAAGRLGEA